MTADIIVIGGGIIGSSITYHLAKRGKKVVQLERKYLTSGASGACDQMVIPQSKAPNEHLKLALYSVELYKELSRELDADLEYVQKGALILIENQKELKIMEGIVKKQNALGLPSEIISVKDALDMQPGIAPDAIVAAVHCSVDGEVNPFRTTLAYSDKAARLGAVIKNGCPVTGILQQNGRITGVETPEGPIYAELVVNAAGAWAPVIGEMAGLQIPIRPRRGQIFITEAVPEFVKKGTLNARYIVAKHHPEMLREDHSLRAELGVGISLTRSRKGNVLFGSTREFAGYHTENTYEGLKEALANAVHLMPGLKKLNIIRTMAGLRPYPPDSKPLIGPVHGLEGFFMAAGHEGDGICLAPATGKMTADLILDGHTDVPAAASFDPNRFSDSLIPFGSPRVSAGWDPGSSCGSAGSWA